MSSRLYAQPARGEGAPAQPSGRNGQLAGHAPRPGRRSRQIPLEQQPQPVEQIRLVHDPAPTEPAQHQLAAATPGAGTYATIGMVATALRRDVFIHPDHRSLELLPGPRVRPVQPGKSYPGAIVHVDFLGFEPPLPLHAPEITCLMNACAQEVDALWYERGITLTRPIVTRFDVEKCRQWVPQDSTSSSVKP